MAVTKKREKNFKEIFIKYKKEDKKELLIKFEDKEYSVNYNLEAHRDISYLEDKKIYYFRKHIVLRDIKQTFNYLYLPLHRSSVMQGYESEDEYYLRRRIRTRKTLDTIFVDEPNINDLAMIRVEKLINQSFNEINSNLNRISDEFRNDILKSLLNVKKQEMEANELFANIFPNFTDSNKLKTISKIEDTQATYIKTLKELSLITSEEEEGYTHFFKKIIKKLKIPGIKPTMNDVFEIYEVNRLEELMKLAKKAEEKKADERKSIDIFLNTMNEFIKDTEEEKEIKISNTGRVYFTTKYSERRVSIHFLSSGEKQLMIFFANLIFKVGRDKAGIFVVDEPELSLHLSWQKKFVEKILEINKNIQLIFATHAPEIIGKNRNKMYRLVKKYKA